MQTNYPQILHHGGKEGVTGSCHELQISPEDAVLIDCGLFQGKDEASNSLEIDFPVEHIRALVVTHVHIDHVGRIPYLLAAGFKGPILCSEPSALLLPLVLEDALKIGFTRNRQLIDRFLKRIEGQIVPLPYGRWHRVSTEGSAALSIKLKPAGHILGSAYVECRVKGKRRETRGVRREEGDETNALPASRVVFSGDLGAPYTPLLPAPRSPYRADWLVLESTYGGRVHEGRRLRRNRLKAVIERALADRGVVLVPAFSIGRTQELLYELEELITRHSQKSVADGLNWDDLEIIIDSPLASRFTDVYRQLQPFWDREARGKLRRGRHPLSFEQLTCIDSHGDHQNAVDYLKKTARPCLVIAASGMCSGGRIMNYLKALIEDSRTDILFVGYQAVGTPGRDIQQYGPRGGYVVLEGKRYDIRSGVHTIGGYSAHADEQNLVSFVRRMRHRPSKLILVHGEQQARQALKQRMEGEFPEMEIL